MLDMKLYNEYSDAAWQGNVEKTREALKKIYKDGAKNPFTSNIILHNLPYQQVQKHPMGKIRTLLKLRKYIKTSAKAEKNSGVQEAREIFMEAIRKAYPKTGPIRQALIDFSRFKIYRVLPKASDEIKAIIKDGIKKYYL